MNTLNGVNKIKRSERKIRMRKKKGENVIREKTDGQIQHTLEITGDNSLPLRLRVPGRFLLRACVCMCRWEYSMSWSKTKTFQKVSLRYMNDDVIKRMNDDTNECLLSYQGIHFAHTQHSQMTGSEWKLRIWGSILLHYAADGV